MTREKIHEMFEVYDRLRVAERDLDYLRKGDGHTYLRDYPDSLAVKEVKEAKELMIKEAEAKLKTIETEFDKL